MKKIILFTMMLFLIFSCKKEKSDGITNIALFDYTGKNIEDFYKDKDKKLIILNYWATYCSPCKEEIKDFVKLNSLYSNNGILIIGATSESSDSLNLIKKLSQILKINYPVLYGVENKFMGETILGLPTTYIIDKNLNIIEKIDGKRDFDYFKKIIEANLN